jgi:Calcineurin-like phosphoesterase
MPGRSNAKPKPAVYNLSWYSEPFGTESKPAQVPRGPKGATISLQKHIGVVILYPALATPEILVGNTDKLELLLLTQLSGESEDKLRMRILNQLKVSSSLDPTKKAAQRALFVDSTGNLVGTEQDRKIEIEKIPFESNRILATASGRFSGYLDIRPYTIYRDAGYHNLYRISMSSKVLAAALGSEISCVGEPQDRILDRVLDKRTQDPSTSKSWAKQDDGRFYSFSVGDDIDPTEFDRDIPIQSYHPVYLYGANDFGYANLGHISDVHMAARQQILAKTIARVIDYWDAGNDADLDSSPRIGSIVNICSRDMIQILDELVTSADLLLIGGDLVDFLRSLFMSADVAKDVHLRLGFPWRVWDAVSLGKNYAKSYKDGVDMVGFFGVLYTYCRLNSIPAFAVTGNHDCYHLPYGLSPRIDVKVYEKRANEGIPSDHNLTFYEALLAFGETYGELVGGLKSPFKKELFDWFYMLFTPFTDFSVELPKQNLVAYGWGDREDLFDIPGTAQGIGHLPRSKDAIANPQLSMLTTAIAKKKKVILLTHFTFVSYDYAIPVSQGDTDLGYVFTSLIKEYNKYNFGSFEKNRSDLFEDHCVAQRDIQIVLTGHSHRRALYLADRKDRDYGRSVVRTRHFDFDSFAHAKAAYPDRIAPAIIVSDSGGTIPRYNFGGEFDGQGSDSPSGTIVRFDASSGELIGVKAARATKCRPRIVVAVDYLDIQKGVDVIDRFRTVAFSSDDEGMHKLTKLTFEIKLSEDLEKLGFWVEELTFFAIWGPLQSVKIPLLATAKNIFEIFGSSAVGKFTDKIAHGRKSNTNFLSMKFGRPADDFMKRFGMSRYDFDSPWCWEFQVNSDESGPYKMYRILRDKERAEKPNFDWRRETIPQKYVPPESK